MNVKLRNTLAIAGLMSIMTISVVGAESRAALPESVTITDTGRVITHVDWEQKDGLSNINTVGNTNGGAISSGGGANLTISAGTFENNSLTSAAANVAVFGGAIAQAAGEYAAGSLTIKDGVIFRGNSVISPAQVYENGAVDNAAGGAIYLAASNAVIGNVQFLNNSAKNAAPDGYSFGGAIFMQSSPTVKMGDVVFTGNTAKYGGALYNGDSFLTMGKATFTGNKADDGYGGAIYMYEDGASLDVDPATIVTTGAGTKFDSNVASSGGAIANFDAELNIGESNIFTGNKAETGFGGAIYNYNDEGTSVTNIAGGTSFTNNVAQKGGAIYNSGKVTLTSAQGKDITFSGNTATAAKGGASVYLDGANSKLLIDGTSGKVSFQDNAAIAGVGSITKTNAGTVEFVNNKDVSGYTGKYTQSGGTIILNNSAMFNNYDITAGGMQLLNGSTATIDSSQHKFGGDSLTIADQNSVLTLSSTIDKNVQVNLLAGGKINVQDATLTLNSASSPTARIATYAEGTLENGDTWEGDIANSTTKSSLVLDGFNHSTASGGGNFTQTNGSLTLKNGSELTLGNAQSSVSGGSLSVQANSTLAVGGGSAITGGTTTIQKDGSMNIQSGGSVTGGTTTIQNGGNVTVSSGGSISGKANTTIQSGATLNVAGGTLDATTGTGKTNIQAGGNLVISDSGSVKLDSNDTWAGKITNNNSTLTLSGVSHDTKNGGYEQTSGILNLENKSSLTLGNNGTISNGTVNVTGSNLVVASGGTIQGGSVSVKDGSSFTVQDGGSVAGGQVTFTGSGNTVDISGDVLAAAIFDVTEGNTIVINSPAKVTLDGATGTADEWSGTVQLNGGTLNFLGSSNGTNGGFLGDSGTLNITGTQPLTVAADSYIKDTVTTTVAENSSLGVAGGNVGFNDKTVWAGTVNVSAGNLTLNNVAKGANAVLAQTTGDGTTTITGNSFVLDNANDEISAGTLKIGTDSASGLLTQNAGSIKSSADVYINGNGTLDIKGGETTLDSGDTWLGTVQVSNGDLTLSGIQNNNGKLLALGGNVTINNASTVLIANGSKIEKGADVVLDADSAVNVQNNGLVEFDKPTEWLGTVNLKSGGVLNYGTTQNGLLLADGGELNTETNSILTVAANSYIKDAVTTTVVEESSLNVTGGDVEFNDKTVWAGTVDVSAGNLTLNNVTKGANAVLTQTTGDGTTTITGNSFVLDNANDEISAGTLKIGTDSASGLLTQNVGSIKSSADVYINGNGTLDINGGETTLDSGDTWLGTVQVSNGDLTLSGIQNNNGKLLALGGNVTINNASTVLIANGSKIEKGAEVVLDTDSAVSVQNNGLVEFDKPTEWLGTVNLKDGGVLNYDTTQNGLLLADGGELNTKAESILNINTGSYIEEAVNVTINGQLNISGTNAEEFGYVTLSSGDTLLGNTNINSYGVLNLYDNVKMADNGQTITFQSADSIMNLETNNKLDLKAELVGESGQINKNGAGDVKFSGGTSEYKGNLLVNNSGDLTFVDEDGFGGHLQFGNVEGQHIGIIADKIHGAINQTVDAQITYSTYRDIDLNFNDKVNVLKGALVARTHNGKDANFNNNVSVSNNASLIVHSGRNVNFNAPVDILGEPNGERPLLALYGSTVNVPDLNAENSLIYTNAKESVFGNISLIDSNLQIAQNGFTSDNLFLSGHSGVQLMNGVITDNNVGEMVVDDAAIGNFSIDISPRDWTSDKILAGSITTNGIGGTLNINDFQFINKCPIDRHVPLKIFDTATPGYENLVFAATNKEIRTPIGYYGLFPTGNGNYNASLTRYVPEVFRGQVATMSTWQNQLTVNNLLFDHVQQINMQYLAQSNPNKYAALYPQFAPYQYNKKDGSLWFKPFGVIEKLNMTQGLNVNNTFYGAIIGADFPAVELKKGWTMLPTAYIGYTGAHQSYDGVGMYQNGGQAGAMATFMKKDFIGSIMAFGGGYNNRMDVGNATDNTGNWVAGAAAKAAYNFHPTKHFVIQPSLLAAYTYLGQQNWHSNYGDMSMRAEMLNGVNVAPGVNFIYGRETWSMYATVQYFYNVLGYTGGLAGNDVDLPHLRMRHGFLQYGVGATKTWKDRFSGYLQLVIRNGGRTGIGFMGGITFKF